MTDHWTEDHEARARDIAARHCINGMLGEHRMNCGRCESTTAATRAFAEPILEEWDREMLAGAAWRKEAVELRAQAAALRGPDVSTKGPKIDTSARPVDGGDMSPTPWRPEIGERVQGVWYLRGVDGPTRRHDFVGTVMAIEQAEPWFVVKWDGENGCEESVRTRDMLPLQPAPALPGDEGVERKI